MFENSWLFIRKSKGSLYFVSEIDDTFVFPNKVMKVKKTFNCNIQIASLKWMKQRTFTCLFPDCEVQTRLRHSLTRSCLIPTVQYSNKWLLMVPRIQPSPRLLTARNHNHLYYNLSTSCSHRQINRCKQAIYMRISGINELDKK